MLTHSIVKAFLLRRPRRYLTIQISPSRSRGALDRDGLILTHIAHVEKEAAYIAVQVRNRFDKDDLAAEGVLKLTEIAGDYDPNHERGASFWTFAKRAVRGAMWERVRRKHLREASHLELMPEHLEAPAIGPGAEELVQATEERELATEALTVLDPRERFLIGRFYAGEDNFEVIGRELGITSSQASRIHRQALAKMEGHLRRRGVSRRGVRAA